MVWFLVDDVLPFHERVLRAGNAAMGLWVRGGSWCAGQLTDGFIPADVARTLGSPAEIRTLVRVGLWSPHVKDEQDGFLFHAWAEDGTGQKRQPTKVEVEERRRKDREKKARDRARAKGAPVPAGVPEGHPEGIPDALPEGVGSTRPDQAIPSPLASLEGGAPPVDNPGDDPEPSARCVAHVGVARPPRCGACKDARLEHEQWQLRTLAAEKRATARQPAWDVRTHCEHGQIRGACEICAYEQNRAGTVIVGPWGGAPCDADAAPSPARI